MKKFFWWVINKKGKVLIQKRSANKKQSPGKWDVSFGGHCAHFDTSDVFLGNVVKEGYEELGLSITEKDVVFLGSARYTSMNGQNHELVNVFFNFC